MAQISTTPLVSGQQSWDTIVNDNFETLETSGGWLGSDYTVHTALTAGLEILNVLYPSGTLQVGDRIEVDLTWSYGTGVHDIEVFMNGTSLLSTLSAAVGHTKLTLILTASGDSFMVLDSSDGGVALSIGSTASGLWNTGADNDITVEIVVPTGGSMEIRSTVRRI